MKILLGLHIILLAAFIYLGYYLIEVKEQLVEDFFEVGWENYEGPSLDVPSNIYSCAAIACTLYTIFLARKMLGELHRLGMLMLMVGVCFLCFGIIMFLQDGTTSVQESILAWQVYAVIVGLLTGVAWGGEWSKKQKAYHSNILDDFNEH